MVVKIKKQKPQKNVLWKLKFKDYTNCLKINQIENKIKQIEKTKLIKKVLKKTITNS